MIKLVLSFIVCIVLLTASFYIGRLYERGGLPKGKLNSPIHLFIGEGDAVIPKGATVSLVQTFGEGNEIIRLYINYKGEPIEYESPEDWSVIDAIPGMNPL